MSWLKLILDRGFATRGIGARGFYSKIYNPKSSVKQSGQTWKSVFWRSTCFYIIYFWRFWLPSTRHLLHRVQRVMHNNVVTPGSMNVAFTMIGFAIQKSPATQLVAYLLFYSCAINHWYINIMLCEWQKQIWLRPVEVFSTFSYIRDRYSLCFQIYVAIL